MLFFNTILCMMEHFQFSLAIFGGNNGEVVRKAVWPLNVDEL